MFPEAKSEEDVGVSTSVETGDWLLTLEADGLVLSPGDIVIWVLVCVEVEPFGEDERVDVTVEV